MTKMQKWMTSRQIVGNRIFAIGRLHFFRWSDFAKPELLASYVGIDEHE